MDSDTIAAIATPLGSGGIGIIRISGKEAAGIAGALFRPSRQRDLQGPLSHRLYLGRILDPETGRDLDEVMMVCMQAPRSYTREDVVEIHSHSGPAALRAILDLVLGQGARLADPGEFTLRAFLNGRIDLTQAEAVIDIVNARTRSFLEIAAAQLHGGLSKTVETCREALLDLQAELEAAIDFPEEPETALRAEAAAGKLEKQVLAELIPLVKQYGAGRILREGLRVVVAGLPNAGKSSLMNRLLQRERAIVSPFPGTTRDFLEEPLNLGGLAAMIVDTAGLQETEDPVERIGVEKTREKIREADLLLFLVDAARPMAEVLPESGLPDPGKPTILVLNKMDLRDPDWDPEIPKAWQGLPRVRISALQGHGIKALKDKMVEIISGGKGLFLENPIVPNARQKAALDRALQAAQAARQGLYSGRSPEFVSMDVGEAADALGEILGVTLKPDVLETVFSRFCIGK